ncbi:MAG: GIY-YIG nuclease family protein [Selenomonadaceae bacterium]|nr:GIY-YIG nuclease family protein [Selenomonadaceae bacterium]
MIIYLLTNKPDGKAYVGQTRRTLEERLREHKRDRRSATYIDRTIRKYGIKNFDVEIIEVCFTIEELKYWEQFWIKELNTKAPNGYNLTDGGEGSKGYITTSEMSAKLSEQRKGRRISPEHRVKISERLKGRVFSPEHCAAISAAKMGHEVSDETRAKLSVANKGKKASDETRAKMSASAANKKAIRCIELNAIFSSMKAALEWLVTIQSEHVSAYILRKACRGKRPEGAGGYHWEYVDCSGGVVETA